jgi:hypothetical protein
MRKYGYLVVEGPHDVQFAYRLLSPFGMKRVQHQKDLDEFFYPLIPRNYPPDGDLQKRMSTPLFLQNETHAIAIHSAIGDSQLVNVMVDNTEILGNLNAVVGIGILLDSDKEIPANQRYANIKQELAKKSLLFKLHDISGQVTQGTPKLGAFVLPDNVAVGTLEDLLLESAKVMYPDLLAIAKDYVEAAEKITFHNKDDGEDFNKPAGKNKAMVGAMANIMRPGKAVQVSIQDNQWLKKEALSIPRIKSVQDFLKVLFELTR